MFQLKCFQTVNKLPDTESTYTYYSKTFYTQDDEIIYTDVSMQNKTVLKNPGYY